MSKTPLLIAVLLASTFASAAAMAQAADGKWLVRARAVYIDPENKSDAVPALAVPSDAIHVSTKTIPEVDISYFFTPNIAAELILTYPQKHDVTVTQSALGGPTNIGNFKHLPPTLTLQYHFIPEGTFRPYVGAGVNYTRFSSVNLNVPTVGSLGMDSSSFGLAVQAGADYKIGPQTYLNFDIKKIQLRSDITLNGAKISRVTVDPWLVGVGIGYRF